MIGVATAVEIEADRKRSTVVAFILRYRWSAFGFRER
jgi:hypothetical protein